MTFRPLSYDKTATQQDKVKTRAGNSEPANNRSDRGNPRALPAGPTLGASRPPAARVGRKAARSLPMARSVPAAVKRAVAGRGIAATANGSSPDDKGQKAGTYFGSSFKDNRRWRAKLGRRTLGRLVFLAANAGSGWNRRFRRQFFPGSFLRQNPLQFRRQKEFRGGPHLGR